MKETKCPGCSRPLSQHLHNSRLGREETREDYEAWSFDCPASQAIAEGQAMWKAENKVSIDAHIAHSDNPDPAAGIYWISQGVGERLPS